MATAVLMPKVGISVESCIITKWLKKPGDLVEVGELLFTYETDKSSMECESTEAGQLLEIFYQEFDDVPVYAPVCAVGREGDDISSLRPQQSAEGTGRQTVAAPAVQAAVGSTPGADSPAPIWGDDAAGGDSDRLKPSPRARRLAQRQHVDLRYASPSGPYGRIVERDVRRLIDSKTGLMTAAAAETGDRAPAAGTAIGGIVGLSDLTAGPGADMATAITGVYTDVKMSGIRRTIARNMEKSLREIPQLTHHFSFDATEIQAYRAQLKATPDAPNITLGDMVMFAVTRVIKRYPELNASFVDGDTLRCYEGVNLGFAVDTPRGLMVPVVRQADAKSLSDIAAETKMLAKLAQDGRLGPDDMSGGTFTVSNLGAMGVESFTPIINPPQTGILGVCAIVDRVRSGGDLISLYPAMGLSLTYDHRAIDGAPASRFVEELCRTLEQFTTLLKDEEV